MLREAYQCAFHIVKQPLPANRRSVHAGDEYIISPNHAVKRQQCPGSFTQTPLGTIGMTICYDMRFPSLYRRLAQAGAQVLSVPSAFHPVTGAAHWETLLRARAIETGCFVFAPNQFGKRPWGRRTYGHSLIVSPWGEILGDAGEERGIAIAEIDPAAVAEARRMIPALTHDREIEAPTQQSA